MSRKKRFLERQAIRKKLAEQQDPHVVDASLVNEFLTSNIDEIRMKAIEETSQQPHLFSWDETVPREESQALLQALRDDFNNKHFVSLVDACKKSVFHSIVVPFGIGKLVARFDKDGGNVTTEQNFTEGVTATKEDQQRYAEYTSAKEKFNREPYDYDPKVNRFGEPVYNKDGHQQKVAFNPNKKKQMYSKMEEGRYVQDGYTGKNLGQIKGGTLHKEESINLEHITSVKAIDEDEKNHLYSRGATKEERLADRVDLARDDRNLTLVEGGLNKSKGKEDLKKWAQKSNSKDPSKTNTEYYEVDPIKLEQEYRQSKDFLAREQQIRKFQKQGKELLETGAKEGIKMGFQQVLGLIIAEFFEASFDEVLDIYKNGYSKNASDESIIDTLKLRCSTIKNRVIQRMKNDALEVGMNAFISGFLSNLVTTVINTFVKTLKNYVRLIREGFFSLLRAIKILCFPPKGMTDAQAAHEASKIIISGVVLCVGVHYEQAVYTLISAMPMLEPIGEILSIAVVGGLSALTSSILVYAIDKIDAFQVMDVQRHHDVMNQLEKQIEELNKDSEELIEKMVTYV